MGVDTALDLYAALAQWLRMIRNGMSRDISWQHQGGLYVPLYGRLLRLY
jgi:glycogen synthase